MSQRTVKDIRPGILTPRELNLLKQENLIECEVENECAIDLHLSHTGSLMKGSVKLKGGESFSMISNQPTFVDTDNPLTLKNGTVLEPKNTYVIPLKENFRLGDGKFDIYGCATGKSSIGRLDVLSRLICDGSDEFDTLVPDYTGSLWVEVTPITFPIFVKENMSLNQLRLFRGEPELSKLSNKEIGFYKPMNEEYSNDIWCDLTLDLSPERIGDQDVIAFTNYRRVFDKEDALDLSQYPEEKIDPRKYWRRVPPNPGKYIEIEADHFYILRSKERFALPLDVGVHCQAITENLGEIRIHYAGFVHPGFGSFRQDGKGTPLTFEVRGHTVNAFLRDGDVMARISYYRTSTEATKPEREGDYEKQELKLSKYFDMSKWEA